MPSAIWVWLMRRLGEVERAIEYHEQALSIHREVKNRQGEGSTLGNLGLVYADLGEVERAKGYWQEALVIFQEIQSPTAKRVEQWLEEVN